WLGFRGKCYYFLETESDWNTSRANCTDYGASLATIDNEEELKFSSLKAFIQRCQGPANRWFGLHKEEADDHWPWTDGTAFTNWFEVQGGSPCAYLNQDRISSSLCHTGKNWVCSRPGDYVLWKQKAFPE
ncbi:CLC2E protein, partial [Penelope pileata]|nr:CLC2E protein [Penelope pileata]